jgi:predicted AlkP superfamily pyrophosphatase or phosphodiesterase
MTRRLITALASLSLLVTPLMAQPVQSPPAAPATTTPPRLVVVISVDQFSADLFAEYRPYFTDGLRRLSDQGVVFPSGYQSHAATETCPGHSTILTGSRPARTGIVANDWYDLALSRQDKSVYCAEDERATPPPGLPYVESDMHLRVPALGDYMHQANRASRVVSVAGKDRAAIMMGGHTPDQIWWWRDHDRQFVSYAGRAAPETVTRANAALTTRLAQAREGLEVPPVCAARGRAVPVPGASQPVGAGRLAREANQPAQFKASPEFDATVLAIGAGLRDELRLGQGSATDLLILGLSATDYVGHSLGTQGQEMCLQLMGLDRELGQFFAELDHAQLDYMVVLTADHGGVDIPERAAQNAQPDAVRVDARLSPSTMGQELGRRLGLQGPMLIGGGPFGDMYVDTALPAAARARVLAEAVRTYRAHPQVAAVFTKAELNAAPMPTGDPREWTLLDRARASFDMQRSGDFVVLLKPLVTPIATTSRGYVATHGSPYDYDRRVPILFWRRGWTPFEQPLAAETVDILPTLAGVLGLALPAGRIDGHCRDLIEGPASSCPTR